MAFSPLAQAGPLNSITFNVMGWNASTPNSTSSSLSQQANTSNPLIKTNSFVTGTATGLPNWFVASGEPNTLGNFVTNGGNGGTINSFTFAQNSSGWDTILSTSGFGSVTLLKLTFTLANDMTTGTIVHDDGMSIYNAAGTEIVDSSAPTTPKKTKFDLSAGTYSLYYVEANGAPSELSFQNVTEAPEPGTLALFGAGLLGCALFIGRRRRMGRLS